MSQILSFLAYENQALLQDSVRLSDTTFLIFTKKLSFFLNVLILSNIFKNFSCVSASFNNFRSLSYPTTTTTTSVLMSLSRSAGVENFCFNWLLPFFWIVCIISSQATLFQILLYALFSQFPFSTLLPFLRSFNLHSFTYLRVDVSTNTLTIPLRTVWIIISSTSQQHPIPRKISRHPIDQSHPTHSDHATPHPTHLHVLTFHNKTVQQSGVTQHW